MDRLSQGLISCSRVQFHGCYWEYHTEADIDTSDCGDSGIPVFHGCRFSRDEASPQIPNGSSFLKIDHRIDSWAQQASRELVTCRINDKDKSPSGIWGLSETSGLFHRITEVEQHEKALEGLHRLS
jgi:hypothetical protein